MKYFIGFILMLTGCLPQWESPQSLLEGPRIVAVRSVPAEVFPGETVELELALADVAGPVLGAVVEWAFCAAPKPPVENNVVASSCLRDAVRPITGNAQRVTVTIPDDACALFGPLLPPSGPMDVPARPRDPDETGGYYQPVRVTALGQRAIGVVRIRCGLAIATPETAARFQAEYVPNRHPVWDSVRYSADEKLLLPSRLPAGKSIAVRLVIPVQSRESYLHFDPAAQALAQASEVLFVSWLSSSGRFALAQTGVEAADRQTAESGNTWVASDTPGPAHFWTVLRDSRGGVVAQSHAVEIVAP